MASLQQSDEDYNLPSDERSGLLLRLQDAFGDVPPHFWAACYLCDIRMLLVFVQITEISPEAIRVIAGQTRIMVACWNQSARESSRTTTPQVSPMPKAILQQGSSESTSSPHKGSLQDNDSPPAKRRKIVSMLRSRSARENAAQRDGHSCVLTGVSSIDVAHIYPFCLLKEEEDTYGKRHNFWHMLKNFWPAEKVAAWEAELFPDGTHEKGLETAKNLITLSKDAHEYWNKGAFALKPISVSDDKTTLTIQFFWQGKHHEIQPTMSLLTKPLSTKTLDSNNGARLTDYRGPQDPRVKSGDIFELKTDDAEARPLPSFTLLEMQWFLQRVTGMAGAADIEDDFGEDDWDEAISNLGLDAAGEISFMSGDLGTSDPAVPDLGNDYPLPSIEGPKHHTEGAEGEREGVIAQHQE